MASPTSPTRSGYSSRPTSTDSRSPSHSTSPPPLSNPKKRSSKAVSASEYLKQEQKKKFTPPNLSESDYPPLPPKRVRRKNGMPVQPVPRSAKPQGELLTTEEKKVSSQLVFFFFWRWVFANKLMKLGKPYSIRTKTAKGNS